MKARPENEFATIRDLNAALADLIERGLGDLAFQIIVAPDSTLQALARNLEPNHDHQTKPALMITLTEGAEGPHARFHNLDRATERHRQPAAAGAVISRERGGATWAGSNLSSKLRVNCSMRW